MTDLKQEIKNNIQQNPTTTGEGVKKEGLYAKFTPSKEHRIPPSAELKKEPILMIEGIDVRELGEVFAGYYLNNSEEVTKIINLYRNQGKKEMQGEIKMLIKGQENLIKENLELSNKINDLVKSYNISLELKEKEMLDDFYKLIDDTDKECGWEENPATKHRAILVLTLKERLINKFRNMKNETHI